MEPRFSEKYSAGDLFRITTSNNPKGRPAGELMTFTGEETWWCGEGYVPIMRNEQGKEFAIRRFYLEFIPPEE